MTARCARNRARHHGIRALRQRRPDRDRERGGAASSRSDCYTGGPVRIARRLHLRPLRRRRRAELLWADLFDQHRRAVGDVDRILRAKSRRNFRSRRRLSMRLIINLKTARGAGARHSTGRPRPRRQGDRISAGLAAIAYGTFETWVQSSSCKLSNLLCGTTSPLCSCSEQVRLFEHAT